MLLHHYLYQEECWICVFFGWGFWIGWVSFFPQTYIKRLEFPECCLVFSDLVLFCWGFCFNTKLYKDFSDQRCGARNVCSVSIHSFSHMCRYSCCNSEFCEIWDLWHLMPLSRFYTVKYRGYFSQDFSFISALTSTGNIALGLSEVHTSVVCLTETQLW